MIIRNKEYFFDRLSEIGINKSDAKNFFNLFLDTIIEGLVKEEEVNLKNFGKFILTKKRKSDFVNPKTGKVSSIKFQEKVKFIPSVNLVEYINRNAG